MLKTAVKSLAGTKALKEGRIAIIYSEIITMPTYKDQKKIMGHIEGVRRDAAWGCAKEQDIRVMGDLRLGVAERCRFPLGKT
jgi:hypothetical protein